MAELKFSIGVDDSKVEQAVQRMRQQFETISRNAVTSGKSIDDVVKRMVTAFEDGIDEFSTMSEQLEFQKQVVKDLGSELDKLGESLKEVTPSGEWETVDKSLQEAKQALVEWNEALAESEQEAMAADNANESLRSQLRKMREELVAMEAAGKRGTKEYRELQEQAGKLQDAISDATKQMSIMSHDQRGFQGIISGLSGVSGAMSAAMGVMGMFTDENEKMQKVMLKVQSLMSITVGLQQLQATLDKDSAFRLVTLNGLKEWWAKVTTQAAAAQTAENAAVATSGAVATGAAGGFKLLGAAIKSIPGLGWLLAAVSALGTIIALVVKRLGKEKELTGEMQRQKKLLDEIADAKSAAAKATQKDADALVIARDRLNTQQEGSSEWKRTVKDIADIIGVQADGLEKNIGKVRTLTDAYIKMKMAEKLGDEYLTRATNIKVDTEDIISKIGRLGKKDSDQAEELLSGLGLLSDGEIKRYIKAWKKSITDGSGEALAAYHDQQEWLRRQVGYEANKYVKLYEEQAKQLGRASLTFENYNNSEEQRRNNQESANKAAENQRARIEAAKKAAEEAGKELMEIETSMQKEKDDKAIDIMNEGFKKREAQIDKEYNEEQRRIGELGGRMLALNNEIAKNEAAALGKYFEAMTELKPEQQSLIDTLLDYATQKWTKANNELQKEEEEFLLKPFKDVLNEFPTILQRWHDIEKKYADKRKALYDEDGKLRVGVTKETLDNIDKAEKEEMRRLFSDINSDNTGFKNFLGTLENYTLKQLETMLEKAKAKFEELSNEPDADVKITAQYGELIYVLEELIKKKEQFIDLSFAGNSEELKKLTSAARELAEALGFDSETQEFLNNMLDVFEMVADIATEISNTFQDVANIASDVSDEVADTTSSIADSRDWITMVIKLVIKLVSWIVKATDKVKQTKELLNNTLTEHVEPALSNIDLSLSNIDLYSNIGDVQQAVYSLIWTLDELRGTYNSMSGSGKDAALDMELLHDKVLYLSKSILDLYHSGKMLGSSDPYENQINSLNNYSYQIQVLTAKLNIYKNALANISNSDKNAEERANLQQTISQIEGEIASAISSSFNTITDIIEGKLGTSFDSMAEQLADTLWDAFDSGADAAQAWADTVDDIIKNMTRKLIMESIILNPLKEILNRLTGNWVTVDNEGRYHIDQEAINSSLPSLQQELMGLYEQVITAYEGLDDVLKGFAQFGNDATETTSKGIAQASQESIDELNGRLTVIQAHTAQLLENSGLMRLDVASIRSIVGNISGDTAHMRTKIDDIAHSLDVVLTRI